MGQPMWDPLTPVTLGIHSWVPSMASPGHPSELSASPGLCSNGSQPPLFQSPKGAPFLLWNIPQVFASHLSLEAQEAGRSPGLHAYS